MSFQFFLSCPFDVFGNSRHRPSLLIQDFEFTSFPPGNFGHILEPTLIRSQLELGVYLYEVRKLKIGANSETFWRRSGANPRPQGPGVHSSRVEGEPPTKTRDPKHPQTPTLTPPRTPHTSLCPTWHVTLCLHPSLHENFDVFASSYRGGCSWLLSTSPRADIAAQAKLAVSTWNLIYSS